MRERPDVILLPGDIHHGSRESLERTLPELRALLSQLRAPGGVYFVLGDSEGLRKARRELAGTGVRLLHDQVARTRVRGRDITIGGIQRTWRSAPARGVIARLERAPGEGDVRILLAHRPDAGLLLRRGTRVDLTVAGHTHGGQVALPLLGPPVLSTGVPSEVGAGGLHDLGGGRRIYVSRGIGMERGQAPPVRIGVPPEVSLLRLR
jgi:predicted MPP superfamily phosphohydrolase